jgi:hypothetical protein
LAQLPCTSPLISSSETISHGQPRASNSAASISTGAASSSAE